MATGCRRRHPPIRLGQCGQEAFDEVGGPQRPHSTVADVRLMGDQSRCEELVRSLLLSWHPLARTALRPALTGICRIKCRR